MLVNDTVFAVERMPVDELYPCGAKVVAAEGFEQFTFFPIPYSDKLTADVVIQFCK